MTDITIESFDANMALRAAVPNVDTGTGPLSGVGYPRTYDTIGAPAVLLDVPERTEAYFGIKPGVSIDNSAGFANMTSWVAEQTTATRRRIKLAPGTYNTDKIEFLRPLADKFNVSLSIEGAGSANTIIIPTTSSNPVFMGIEACFQTLRLRGFTLRGAAATGSHVPVNLDQHSMGIWASWNNEFKMAGISYGLFEDLQIWGFSGPMWMRGSQLVAGATGLANIGYESPNQYIVFENCNITHWSFPAFTPSFMSLGQFGQINFRNGNYDKCWDTTNYPGVVDLGPSVLLSIDYRLQVLSPIAIDITFNTFTNGKIVGGNTAKDDIIVPTMTPVRIVGDSNNFPATTPELTTGHTYYLYRPHVSTYFIGTGTSDNPQIPPNNYEFKLGETKDLASQGVYLDVTGPPMSGVINCSFVSLWAASLDGVTFTTPFPHMLCSYDEIIFVGLDLPITSLTPSQLSYLVIRTGHTTFQLASSKSNVDDNIPLNWTGGNTNHYGFAAYTGNFDVDFLKMGNPYSVKTDCMSVQKAETGIQLAGAQDVTLDLHCERVVRCVEALSGTNATIRDGCYRVGSGVAVGPNPDPGTTGCIGLASGQAAALSIEGKPVFELDTQTIARALGAGRIYSSTVALDGSDFPSSPLVRTSGVTRQLNSIIYPPSSSPATYAIDVGATRDCFVIPSTSASANVIQYINSKLMPGATVSIRCHTSAPGYIEFLSTPLSANIGNVSLGGVQRLRLGRGAVADFRLMDNSAVWTLCGYTPYNTYAYQICTYNSGTDPHGNPTNSYNPDPNMGDSELEPITADLTVQTPFSNVLPVFGQTWTLALYQNSPTSLFNITWTPAFKNTTLMQTGGANSAARITFFYDGSHFVQTGTTGWYSTL